jgi:hypothetical protein
MIPPIHRRNLMLDLAQRVLKAVAAAAAAGVTGYATAAQDGVVAGDEWVALVVAALGAGLVVWAVPNKPAS